MRDVRSPAATAPFATHAVPPARHRGPQRARDVLYALPDDDWAAPRALSQRYGDVRDRLAFLLVRPETVRQGLTPDVLRRTALAGFTPLDAAVVEPHPRLVEELYRLTQVRLADAGARPMWWYMPTYYRLGPAVVVLLTTEQREVTAAERLIAVKGPSNPALTRPGEIRHECGAQNMMMCAVHSSDDTGTMLREACLFFGAERVTAALERTRAEDDRCHGAGTGEVRGADGPRSGLSAPDIEALLGGHGLPSRPCRLPNFHQALAALQRSVLESARVTADPELAPHAAALAARLRGRTADALAHPDYGTRTRALRAVWRDHGAELLGRVAGCPELEPAFLHWSAPLTGTGSAYADLVLTGLRERGHVVDQWAATVLETGWAFHDAIDAASDTEGHSGAEGDAHG
ncbi:nucleoside-diphosphate kinase [Streptomyces sp. NPDC087300]|uniref:nucleoside-diphosphate kinase n=1 Tax=Streptomyces sp. NPDC087300 TaxID=3365780 RepID=UPI00382EF572